MKAIGTVTADFSESAIYQKIHHQILQKSWSIRLMVSRKNAK